MNCPSCAVSMSHGRIYVWKSPWRFFFNWAQTHLRPVFVFPNGKRKAIIGSRQDRPAYRCPQCRLLIVSPEKARTRTLW
jgi:hypothetical protein